MLRPFILRLLLAGCAFATPVSCIAQTKAALFSRDSVKLLAEFRQMLADDDRYRSDGILYQNNYRAQWAIDATSTRRMIRIIKLYGFPSTHRFRLGPEEDELHPHLILTHAPKRFAGKLRPLLRAECEAGAMSTNEYVHILWELDGRAADPVWEGMPGKDSPEYWQTTVKF